MKYNTQNSFWTNTRNIHTAIKKKLSKTDIFRMLTAQKLPPSLLDSLYFAKYDGLKNKLANKMLQQMNWDKVSYGYSITNVGRVDIPVNYGQLTLKEIYGPILYSDVNEKVVGITTVNGRLTFSLSSNSNPVNRETLVKIHKRVMDILEINCGK